MKFIWKYLRAYKKILFGALGLAAVNQIFSLLDPLIFRYLIDNYATKFNELPSQVFLKGVLLLLAGTIGVAFISRVAKTFQSYYVNVIAQRLGAVLYADSVAHSFSLPYAVFEDHRSGEILQKLQKAREDNQTLVQQFINVIFLSFIGIIFVLIYAFSINWLIGLSYFMMIPILATTTYFISRKVKKIQAQVVMEQAALSGATTETLRNVELVKSLGLQRQEIDRLNGVNEQILRLELRKVRMIRALNFIQGTLINGLRTALLFLMLWLIFNQVISLGQLFSLLFYSFFIFNPLAEFGDFVTKYRETQASNDQLKEILNIEPEPTPKNAQQIEKLEDIKFENVSFDYASGTAHSLDGVDFKISSGKTVAFVGPSGSGKSTLVKLMVGLYRPSSGNIYFNGIDNAQIDFEQLRKKIGFVAQDVQLFAGSIRDNLLFVNPDATDEQCTQAMKSASAESILERGGKGLDTIIGEGGLKLSGGERQRLAIARALLREPELVIFDEATSSLDSITEQSITKTIKDIEKTKPDLIRVLIAHRLSTVMHADMIYILQAGKIVEHGKHDSLLKKGGLYAALWKQQSGS